MEPEFAGRVRRLFDAGRHKTIATLRADGSPRISGIECEFTDGELRFGSMNGDDPDAKTWAFHYDAVGNRDKVTAPPTPENPAGNATSYGYDQATGWLTSMTTQLGRQTTYGHDNDGLVTTIVAPTTGTSPNQVIHSTTRHYDPARNLESFTDGNAKETTYLYNPFNQPDEIDRADTTVTSSEYDNNGNMSSQTDAATPGSVTAYGYDALNRLKTLTAPPTPTVPAGNTATFDYDTVGNLIHRIDPGGSCPGTGCATFGYDAADQLKTIDYSDPNTPDVTNIDYDADGQRVAMTEVVAGAPKTSQWTWDSLHRLTSSTDIAGATVGYGYDLRGHLTTLTYPGGGPVVSRVYDGAGRLQSVADGTNTFGFVYDRDSNLITQNFPTAGGQAMSDTFTPDEDGFVAAIAFKRGGANYASVTYSRDGANQLKSEVRTGLPGLASQTYTYTDLEQLKGVGSATNRYDPADNLTHLTTSGQGSSMAYDRANEPCWFIALDRSNACNNPPPGATVFSYDNRGNRIAGAGSYGYDQANRLTSSPGATYTYNGDGLRMSKTVGGTPHAFVWDVSGAVPVLLKDGATSYVYDDNGLPLEQLTGTTPLFYHHDQLGSTRALTNAAGTVVGAYSYYPYGALAFAQFGSVTTPLGFAGQYTDNGVGETGFQYLRSRYYDPATGQFFTRDPAVAQTRAAYAYANGNPVNVTDVCGVSTGASSGWPGTATVHAASAEGQAGSDTNDCADGPGGGGGPNNDPPQPDPPKQPDPECSAAETELATPSVESGKLQNILDDLYKGTTNPGWVGTGTTADAIRYELETGEEVFGRSHIQKGEDYLRGLENWLKANPGAPYCDRLVARSLADDLLDALGM